MTIINTLLHKTLLIIGAALFLTLMSFPANAQVLAPSKIAAITTDKFADPKVGIARLRTAFSLLEREFAPQQYELTQMASRLQQLQTELRNPNIDAAAKTKKYEEAEKLDRDMKFKQEDAKALFERRQRAVMEPIYSAIMVALE